MWPPASQVMITFSHNHCGPRLGSDLVDYYPVEAEQVRLVDEYTALRVRQLVREGKSDSPRDGGFPVSMGLANEQGHPHRGTINFVENQLNPKTGSIHLIDSDTIGLLDKNTGYRPTAAKPDDPYAKKKKKIKKPFKLPTMNVERRGFTGQ